MKTPITYYGGKQKLAPRIVPLIPAHTTYAEVFCGGAAVFFAKRPSAVEVLNDMNGELMNFYEVIKKDFNVLRDRIQVSLHSRMQHTHASVIYHYPELFNRIDRAWAVWVLSSQGFAGQLVSSWGYDVTADSTSRKIYFNKAEFTDLYCQRLEKVQLESKDALYIIQSRDTQDSFFYCDPPYYNSNMGHYKGYSQHDFEQLLTTLSMIKGRFLLSSYPSEILNAYTKANSWNQTSFQYTVSVNAKSGKEKFKTEVLTANYPLDLPIPQLELF